MHVHVDVCCGVRGGQPEHSTARPSWHPMGPAKEKPLVSRLGELQEESDGIVVCVLPSGTVLLVLLGPATSGVIERRIIN